MRGLPRLAWFDIALVSARRKMKIGHAVALTLLIATPALSAAKKTENGVTFECVVTGSDKDGFDLTAE